MACETMRKPRQTLEERIAEITKAVADLERKIASKVVKVVVGPQGAVTFAGWVGDDRSGITDACAYRRIVASGSALTKAALARAEQMSGRSISRQAMSHGVHSHDGGATWHRGH
jgi:hypothetical protein